MHADIFSPFYCLHFESTETKEKKCFCVVLLSEHRKLKQLSVMWATNNAKYSLNSTSLSLSSVRIKRQHEWHNKSLTSFPLCFRAQLESWTVARQRNYSWASLPLCLSRSLCSFVVQGNCRLSAHKACTHSHKSLRAHKCVHTARGQTKLNRAHTHRHTNCGLKNKHTALTQAKLDPISDHITHYPPRLSLSISLQASYLRRAAADWSDLIAERRHRDQQLVVLVEDAAAGGLVQTQQALTAQHVQGETWLGRKQSWSQHLHEKVWQPTVCLCIVCSNLI